MKCPFCAEDIKDDAVICNYCHNNVAIVRGLLDRISELTKRVEVVELAQITKSGGSTPPFGAHDKVGTVAGAIERRIPLVSPVTTLLLAFVALLFAHFIIIVHYDLSLIWLRLASLILPFLFGLIYRQHVTQYLFFDLLVGVGLAGTAIFVMSAIVAKVDQIPVLPTDIHGWREYAEYGASIALSFFAGAISRQTMIAMHRPNVKASKGVNLAARYITAKISGIAPHDPNDPKMDKNLKHIRLAERIIAGSIAAGSALASIWSGLAYFL